jgi:hypothetical protein
MVTGGVLRSVKLMPSNDTSSVPRRDLAQLRNIAVE